MVPSTVSATSPMRLRSIRKCASPSRRPAASIISARLRTACAVKSERATRSGTVVNAVTMSILFQRAPDGLRQILRFGRLGRIVAGRPLGGDLDMRVGRNELFGNWHALDNVDALAAQCIVFHVAH